MTRDVHLVLSPEGLDHFEGLGRPAPPGVRVTCSVQEQPRGMGAAVFGARGYWRTARHLLVVWGNIDEPQLIVDQLKPHLAEILGEGTMARVGIGAAKRNADGSGGRHRHWSKEWHFDQKRDGLRASIEDSGHHF